MRSLLLPFGTQERHLMLLYSNDPNYVRGDNQKLHLQSAEGQLSGASFGSSNVTDSFYWCEFAGFFLTLFNTQTV